MKERLDDRSSKDFTWATGAGVSVKEAAESFARVTVCMNGLHERKKEIVLVPVSDVGIVSGRMSDEDIEKMMSELRVDDADEEIVKVNRQTSFGGLFNKNGRKKW